MSVIYDALQKAENQNKAGPGSAQKKKSKSLVPFLSVICVIAGIIFIFNYLPKKKIMVKVKPPEAPVVQPVIPAKEEGPQIPETPSEENYIIEGIIYSSKEPLAIINGRILKKNDKIDEFEVRDISPNSVELVRPSDNTSLNLTFK
ncbi:MAG: hypothetical protein PHU91_04935 [Candidatus Omnitrophica bacterium]|nr:hypothetical protein [Candidatus Omnitrophota bacterium]MDD5236988.1 hypothetical protein [Candidatus Omnitrophota bacterium]MDD5609911.1 hypothetical protein [Candidatus Omnitrophota bacterium]